MLELKRITKDYALGKTGSVKALKSINLRFKNTGFVAILGPSGCGKTTLLNIISGLDHYTSGDLIIDGISTKQFNDRDWDDYRNKKVGMVFQNYNLVAHLSISENTSLPLTLAGVGPKERKEKIGLAMEATGLVGQEGKNPNQLSGGQQQRVAIARSIINNPTILLADEPTGALDSVTSVLVMNMLNELSKDVLILMVTHNNELAYKYADRIISMKDGQIIGDFVNTRKEASITPPAADSPQVHSTLTKGETDSLKALSTHEIAVKVKKKKARMSFWTAFKMSVKNLATKKGRTVVTSIAASFGIIGVGLVLAVSNGFSGYVSRMEAESLSKLPITIDTYAVPTDSILGGPGGENNELPEYPDGDIINVKPPRNASFHVNNITEDYYNAFLLGGTDSKGKTWPGINGYLNPKGGGKKVSIDNHYSVSANVVTQDANIKDAYKALNTTPLSIVDKITAQSYWSELPDHDDVSEQYDLIAGEMPDYEDPHGLVITVDKYNSVATETLKALGFDMSGDSYENPKLSLADLTAHVFKLVKNEDFYTKEKDTKKVNGLSLLEGKTYSDYLSVLSKMSALDSTATTEDYLPIAEDFINLFVEIDFEKYPEQINRIVEILVESAGDPDDGQKMEIIGLMMQMMDKPPEFTESLDTYLKPKDNTARMKEIYENPNNEDMHIIGILRLKQDVSVGVLSSGVYYTPALTQRVVDMAKNSEIASWSNKYMMLDFTESQGEEEKKTGSMMGIDGLLSFYSMIDDNAKIDGETYSSQRKMVGSDIAVSSISITPKNFGDKDKVLKYLDSYNEGKQDKDQIQYTDIAGSLMASIGTMVSVISTVLIVFASISLVVSSVMIGIIIYVSVIERTKEIGTLRSVGARKKDVGRLFIMESIAIGLFSGLLGVIISYILSLPINYVVNMMYEGYGIGTIAFLNPWHAILLIIISIALTMIAGLIPSLIASRKDPVKCLRAE